MKKEIGGYLELEQSLCKKQNEYHKNCVSLNLGRNALDYLIKSKIIKCIYLPYFLCNCVSDVCFKNNVIVKFYHINSKFRPALRNKPSDNGYVYIVNYYGVLSKNDIKDLKAKYKNIIVDNVHAFFEKPIKHVDTLYSCRKFFGVPDGAYLYTNARPLNILTDNSKNRFAHLKGRLKDGAEAHYKDYMDAEMHLDDVPLLSMSKETKDIMAEIDYLRCKKKRLSNFKYLENRLGKINKLKIKIKTTPFCYPLLIENGTKLKQYLISRKIFIPTLWPNLEHLNSFEQNIVSNIVLIPCDQRYNANDMFYIISAINDWSSSKEIHVRELSLSDIKIINKWHNDKNIFQYLVGNFYGPSMEESRKWIEQYLKYDNHTFRGVVSNDEGVDLGVVYLIDCEKGKEAEVGIFIAEEKFRHLGYGQKMLCWLLDFGFHILKLEKIFLYTLENNKNAINLYKKMGFVFDNRKNKTVIKNGENLTAIYMELKR